MASRRMFALSVVSTDAFLNLSHSAQALYFQLGMRADDDGVVDSPMSIMRMLGCQKEHIEELEKAEFLIPFPSGISIIRHWKRNNYLQNDRHHDTAHPDEFSQLTTDNSNQYVFKSEIPEQPSDTSCIQHVSNMYTQGSIDKFSLEEISLEEDSEAKKREAKEREEKKGLGETIEEKTIEEKNRAITEDYPKRADFPDDESYQATVNEWVERNGLIKRNRETKYV